MQTFKKAQTEFLFQLVIFTIVLYITHWYLLHYFVSEALFFPVRQIYGFHGFITTILYSVINYRYCSGHKNIFNLFMGMTLLKMILAILFLLPLLTSEFANKRPDVFNFFTPYFLFLVFEIFSVTKILRED